jgi:ABC-type lipoprotein export system ATPase subunit
MGQESIQEKNEIPSEVKSKRVYELAKAIGTTPKRVIELYNQIGISVDNHMTVLNASHILSLMNHLQLRYNAQGRIESINIQKEKIQIEQENKTLKTEELLEELKRIKIVDEYGDDVDRKLQYVYNAVQISRKKYGEFKKCEFHLHTPASEDYKLYRDWKPERYKALKLNELVEICVECSLFPQSIIEGLQLNSAKVNEISYIEYLKESNKPFRDMKEYLTYMLIAKSLYEKLISMVVVTDHHTVSGYLKLRHAVEEYFKMNRIKHNNSISVLLGVEILCSDMNHVVGIFSEDRIDEVNKLLNDISIPNQEGTFYPSLDTIKLISELYGIGYIAHINSSDLLGNQPYKSKLFSYDKMTVIGLTAIEHKKRELERISGYYNEKEKEFCIIYEGDSHAIDSIGTKNSWIKFNNNINFISLKKGFEDHGVCVRTDEPKSSDKYIKGMMICPGKFGFLKSRGKQTKWIHPEDRNDLLVEFSRDLNCIIGGRGTGKSTILNLVTTAFNLEASAKTLKFISKHEQVFIVFRYEEHDYILRFTPQVESILENGNIKYFGLAFKNPYDDGDIKQLNSNWVELYKISEQEDSEKKLMEHIKNKRIIGDFFRRGYSINSLVNMIENGTISEFIREVILNGLTYVKTHTFERQLRSLGSIEVIEYLRKNSKNIDKAYLGQKSAITSIISGFNAAHVKQLKLSYAEKNNTDIYLEDLLDKIGSARARHVARTFLTWEDVEQYIKIICEKVGFLEFLNCILNKKFTIINEITPIKSLIDYSYSKLKLIENGLTDINETNIDSVFSAIRERIVMYPAELQWCVLRWFNEADRFDMEFNINHKESIETTPIIWKSIEELSLGQSVAALLTFVFNYGDFADDNTPLIIDQPEDNLDNQYIYKNLVNSLRQIKTKRQVIVVTHSSTIVTNADAEQVIVMGSDNKKGWIETSGYPSNPKVMKHIINHMEGGVPSLKNKVKKYRHYVPELS